MVIVSYAQMNVPSTVASVGSVAAISCSPLSHALPAIMALPLLSGSEIGSAED